ncbi:MAG: hypothetical protein U0167_05740 [bacterium]
MAAVRFLWLRPVLSTLVAVALGLFVVFGLPIPFEKTVGHDVALTVSGAGLDAEHATMIAREMKTFLGAESVAAQAEDSGGRTSFRLVASVTERSSAKAHNAAQALASTLKAAGYEAKADVTPRTERVFGTVYAFASDRVIRVSTDGKTASQLESEIRQQLSMAGFPDAQVSVTDEGAGKQKIGIELHREGAAGTQESPEIVLTKDGKDLGGSGVGQCQMRVEKLKDGAGQEKLVVDITKDARTTHAEVPNVATLSDGAIQSALQSQLDRAGVAVRIHVQGGKVSVESDH